MYFCVIACIMYKVNLTDTKIVLIGLNFTIMKK